MASAARIDLANNLITQQAVPATPVDGVIAATTSVNAAATDSALPLDQFVPSSQTDVANASAAAAGLFTTTQISLFTPAADSVLAESVLQATLIDGETAAANVANTTPETTAQTPGSTPAVAQTIAVPGLLGTQTQLQALNTSLAALGLDQTDIDKVDQIAEATGNFNATSFGTVIGQLEALAQSATQASPTATAALKPAAANAPTPAATDSNTAGLSLAGVQLRLIFTNHHGHSIQVQTPVNAVPVRTRGATA